jgi:hypothetical protein
VSAEASRRRARDSDEELVGAPVAESPHPTDQSAAPVSLPAGLLPRARSRLGQPLAGQPPGRGHRASRTTMLLHMQQTRGNAAVQRLVQRASAATAPAQPVVQREPEAGSAPPPTGTLPPTPSAEEAPTGGPPILFGLDTTENLLYASVLAPGHTVTEIVSYIYLFPELMLDQFWSENPGLPDNPDELVPTGRNLRIPNGRPTDQAARDRDVAMKSGGLLRTEGMEAGDTGAMRYTFSAELIVFDLCLVIVLVMLLILVVYV